MVIWRRENIHQHVNGTAPVIALLSFLMTFPVSGFIWEWFPILQKIQFPWRFNTILAIAAVTVFALAVSEFQEIKFRY